MKKPIFDQFSTDELREFNTEINMIVEQRKAVEEAEAELNNEMRELLSKYGHDIPNGLSVSQILTAAQQQAPKKKTRKPVATKYANPQNQNEKWTGRGRKPRWVQEHLDAGGELETLLV